MRKSEVFLGTQSFRDLEARIELGLKSDVLSTVDAGDVMEVLAEAIVLSEPMLGAVDVWPRATVPTDVMVALGMDMRDLGIDGVIRDRSGRLTAYQVKFRSGRKNLTYGELSTFLAASERAGRLIVTNASSISQDVMDKRDVSSFVGSNLDVLSDRWEEIVDLINASPIQRSRPKPRPHQEEGLAAIEKALSEEDRTQVRMACGTGKTLLGMWLAERRRASKVAFFAPSLALVRQTLAEWASNHDWKERFRFICVCSDQSVADEQTDALEFQKGDDFVHVTTDPAEVLDFLARSPAEAVTVVFSTYQSVETIRDGLPDGFEFDLGLFDEAHKTAGDADARFALALNDSVVPIQKRVFMTATPRNIGKSKGLGRAVRSMDDVQSYGHVAYNLSFREAARQGIICPYKVIISVVNDEDLLAAGIDVSSDEIGPKLQDLAAQIALARAMKDYHLDKAFTFHARVRDAKAFVDRLSVGTTSEFEYFHVSGAMPTGERSKTLSEFRNSSRGIVSNARCLTEGVDVPAVDLVAFMSRKRSKVDIVQAVGRALRLSDGKKYGYVLLPLLVRQSIGETIENAVRREGYDEIWNVLKTLLDQDEMLIEAVVAAKVARNEDGRVDHGRMDDLVEVVSNGFAAEEVERAIKLMIVDDLWKKLPKRIRGQKTDQSGKKILEETARKAVSAFVDVNFDASTSFHLSCSDAYRGDPDQSFVKVRPKHLERDRFIICRIRTKDGWIIPQHKMREFFEPIPMSKRNGPLSWDPRVKFIDGKYLMSTNFSDFPGLDLTEFYVRFSDAEEHPSEP